jgi:hypothetical protein
MRGSDQPHSAGKSLHYHIINEASNTVPENKGVLENKKYKLEAWLKARSELKIRSHQATDEQYEVDDIAPSGHR